MTRTVQDLKGHFRQPTAFGLTALGLSAPVVWFVFRAAIPALRARPLFRLALPAALVICAGTIALRLIRGLPGREGRADVRCGRCGQSKPNAPVRYLELTGIVVVMLAREFPEFCCRSCTSRTFVRTTLHTLAFGFWSLLAVFIAPGVVLNNLAFLVSSLLGATRSAHAQAVLDSFRGYAHELLASGDRATAVKALQRNTGLPTERVERFVSELAGDSSRRHG